MTIYEILSSKPNNPHYLNRYIKFIEMCQQLNSINIADYYEKHHICPKANEMFPEYKNFLEHSWNCANLTARQHFIAHMLLWKVYKNRSMTRAFGMMSATRTITSKIYENIKIQYRLLVSEQMSDTVMIRNTDGITSMRISKEMFDNSEDIVGHTKGMTYAIDGQGNKYYVSTDDPRFKTGELMGNNANKIYITDGKHNRRILPEDIIPFGWEYGVTKKSPKGSKWINNGKTSKMTMEDQIPDGWSLGRIFNKPTNKGQIWINNGHENKKCFSQDIPEGWELGRIINKSSNKGQIWINDGHKNKMCFPQDIPVGWKIGQKLDKVSVGNKGQIWINDGHKNKMCFPQDIPDGWTLGMSTSQRFSK